MNNTNSILEPRLSEYLKRKKFYEDNDITATSISLEKQYMITKDDLHRIKQYNQKEKSNTEQIQLPSSNYNQVNDLINFQHSKFPSSQIVDKRLDRLNQKIKREKDANNQRYNTQNLQNSYDMYSRDFSSTTSKDFENEFTLDNIRDDVNKINDNEYESNSTFNTHELVNPPTSHQYHVTPSIVYNQQLHYQRDDSQKKLLGAGYTYRKTAIPYFEKQNQFDIDNKVNIPANNCRKDAIENLYSGVSEMTGGPLKNIDFENYIKYSYPTSKARSRGFENPFENQFQYIDDDIQNPDHVVSDRPTSTRLDNRTMARPKKRDIY